MRKYRYYVTTLPRYHSPTPPAIQGPSKRLKCCLGALLVQGGVVNMDFTIVTTPPFCLTVVTMVNMDYTTVRGAQTPLQLTEMGFGGDFGGRGNVVT